MSKIKNLSNCSHCGERARDEYSSICTSCYLEQIKEQILLIEITRRFGANSLLRWYATFKIFPHLVYHPEKSFSINPKKEV